MHFLGDLWLPILVATVLCFIGSAVVWMAGPHHKKEWASAPGQDALMDVLRRANATAGNYMFPHADRGDKAAFQAAMVKWAEGPSGVMYIFPKGRMNMGKMMGQQVAYFLLVNFLVALVASRCIVSLEGRQYMHVFRLVFGLTFMSHWLGTIPESIWFGRAWKSVAMGFVDAAVYAALAAGAFGWLWPR